MDRGGCFPGIIAIEWGCLIWSNKESGVGI
jgi:hypothetical protein